MPTALVTGASAGLGLAIARSLADRGHALILDARGAPALERVATELSARTEVVAIPGDVADPEHRAALLAAARRAGALDVLVNNASRLGPSPQPPLARYPLSELEFVYRVDVLAPLAVFQAVLPLLRRAPAAAVVNVTSDAAVEPYPGWGGYGSAKAALDQLTAVLAAEHPELAVYGFDPGDMRTAMHQAAFPGEDISDRPEPGTVAPALLRLLDTRPSSGRYRAADLLAVATAVAP